MQLEKRLEIATDIAHEAGRMISAARHRQDFEQRYKHGSELVTDVDVAVDRLIAERLDTEFLDVSRLTEELSPEHGIAAHQGPLWVIDPIDGTVNFAHGLAHVAVSIAWCDAGQTQLGVVHAPFLGETFTALRGVGAWRNAEPIKPSACDSFERALIATGFPYQRAGRPPLLRRLQAVLAECQDVRRNGSAALDLCDVACGRLDAYYESVSPWDFAAGVLIAREAGARTGHLYPLPAGTPEDLHGKDIIVASQAIYEPLAKILRRADAPL